MSHHRTDARAQTYSLAARRRGVPVAVALATTIATSVAVPALAAPAAASYDASVAGKPGRPAPSLMVTYSYVDTNRDGAIDKVVLVDSNAKGLVPATGASGAAARAGAVSPAVIKLTKQLTAAKAAAAKAAAASAKAQRTAAALAKAAKRYAATARTARQRAYARQLAKKAAVAARVARTANAKAKAAASLVKTLKKTIDKINRVANTTAPAPTAPTAPAPAPTPSDTTPTNTPAQPPTSKCDSLAATFRPVPVSSQWEVSCVDSFPGVITEPGYTVLGLTRFDSGAGLAQVRVLRSQSATQLPATFAHELSHAYSITSMSSSQRFVFLNRIRAAGLTTATDFFSQAVSYDAMPAEIWARTQASCVGYPAPYSTFTEATCSDVTAAKRG